MKLHHATIGRRIKQHDDDNLVWLVCGVNFVSLHMIYNIKLMVIV